MYVNIFVILITFQQVHSVSCSSIIFMMFHHSSVVGPHLSSFQPFFRHFHLFLTKICQCFHKKELSDFMLFHHVSLFAPFCPKFHDLSTCLTITPLVTLVLVIEPHAYDRYRSACMREQMNKYVDNTHTKNVAVRACICGHQGNAGL